MLSTANNEAALTQRSGRSADVVLTIAGSILVTIALKPVGTAAHQALLRILRWRWFT
jgi:hypothetical protein